MSQNKNILKIAILLLTLGTHLSAYPYVVTGRIVDAEDSTPLHGATLVGRNNDGKVRIGIQADQTGRFGSADVKDNELRLEIYHTGYDTLRMTVKGVPEAVLDLGLIELYPTSKQLAEVTVTAAPVIHRADKYVLIPSKAEVERSASSLGLLGQLQYSMPGLQVVETLQQVTINNQTPVYLVNGREVPFSRVQGINNANVQRIELYDTPQMRYGGRVAINFIMTPRGDGGSVVTGVTSAVNAGNLFGNLGLTYFRGKSEWNLNYGLSWRDYDKRQVSRTESFIGRDEPVERVSQGLPRKFRYTDNNLNLDYTFMPNQATMFSATIGGQLYHQHLADGADVSQKYGSDITSYRTETKRSAKIKSPKLDLYFRRQFSGRQTFEMNAYGTYNKGAFTRDYTGEATPIYSMNDNKSWRVGGEARYSKEFKKFTAYFGVNDYFNRAKSTYIESQNPELETLDINNLYAYAQISGIVQRRFSYSVAAGLKYMHSSDGTNTVNAARFKTNITLNYRINNKFLVGYLFMFDPSMPGTGAQSNIVQSVNDIEVRTGNMHLRPSTYWRNRLLGEFWTKNFSANLYLSHSRTNSPMFYDYTFVNDPASPWFNRFMGRMTNGRRNDYWNVQLDATVRNLFNHLGITGTVGWNDYELRRVYGKDSYKFWYASMRAMLNFGQWTLSADQTISTNYSLNGNTYSRPERWNTIGVQYRTGPWFFSATIVNPFTHKGSKYHSWTVSPVHPTEEWVTIKNCANMVMLGITYRTNFGKSMKKAARNLRNGGVDSGVDMNL